eukprot:gene15543-biopygen17185
MERIVVGMGKRGAAGATRGAQRRKMRKGCATPAATAAARRLRPPSPPAAAAAARRCRSLPLPPAAITHRRRRPSPLPLHRRCNVPPPRPPAATAHRHRRPVFYS